MPWGFLGPAGSLKASQRFLAKFQGAKAERDGRERQAHQVLPGTQPAAHGELLLWKQHGLLRNTGAKAMTSESDYIRIDLERLLPGESAFIRGELAKVLRFDALNKIQFLEERDGGV